MLTHKIECDAYNEGIDGSGNETCVCHLVAEVVIPTVQVGRITLPTGLAALKDQKIVLFDALPSVWQRALWGRSQPVTKPEALLEEEVFFELLQATDSPERNAIILQQAAAATVTDATPVGWHVPGPGNLTDIIVGWADAIAAQIKAEDAVGAILSLGGSKAFDQKGSKGTCTRIRNVDALRLLRELPVRVHCSLNGRPIERTTLAGLALIGVALTPGKRVQDLLCQAPEEEDVSVDGVTRTGGWPQLFRPESLYGVLGKFADSNVRQFVAHLELAFKAQSQADLQLLAASAPLKAMAIEADLRAGKCHVPHDQFKNSATGQGTRGCWLVGDEIRSLPGAGSKVEKFLNRNKLVTGTGAVVANSVDSALCIDTEKGILPITQGVRLPVVVTNWAMHGSGQVMSRPGAVLTASVIERHTIQLSKAEFAAIEPTLPAKGDTVEPGTDVIEGFLAAPDDYAVVVVEVGHAVNTYSGDIDLRLVWERRVNDYAGFKIKSLGLKGSIMPLVTTAPHAVDPWSVFDGADYLINLEAAKGTAITLSMWAEAIGGLTIGADDLTEEQLAEYTTWLEDSTQYDCVSHAIHACMVPAYQAAGHAVEEVDGVWYVSQNIEYIIGSLVVEVEAPLVPCRQTKGSMSLMQAMMMAIDVEDVI